MALLEVKGVSKHFGGVSALSRVSLCVEEREIVGLIGPNGAGKTSFFNCLTGLLKVDEGKILLGRDQRVLSGMSSDRILEAGIARTFQNLRIFRNMTLLENVAIGFHARTRSGLWDAFVRSPRARKEEKMIFDQSRELLRFMGLESFGNEIAANLPYGHQKRLEIARALASSPRLLCLDEPVAGMNPSEKEALAGVIRKIREKNIAVLLIEHDMKVVMPLSDRLVVLDEGEVIAEGRPQDIKNNPRVIQAYLGEG
ncbi:MAG: ABC transporter ATP-binding protein [Candidatus Omnitrophica bacterium]|nr:ABC transporter ATP-binding protein [Candidatus Omnitrophota bacterium]